MFGCGLPAAAHTWDFCTGRYTSRLVSLPAPTLLSAAVPLGSIPHGNLYCFTGVQRVRCPCIRNGLLPFQHGGLWSRASSGSAPLPKWSHCTEAGSKRYINIIGQRNGVWPPACVISSSGRTSQHRSSLESSSRRSRPVVPLALHKGEEPPTTTHGVRPARTGTPGCRAGMRSLRSDHGRSTARSEFTRPCAQLRSKLLRLALTEPARGSVLQV